MDNKAKALALSIGRQLAQEEWWELTLRDVIRYCIDAAKKQDPQLTVNQAHKIAEAAVRYVIGA